jgi:glycosyltransferase involved in cell wall biosynthesis
VRLLIANDGFGDAGGVETYLAGILPELQRRGHDVTCLATNPRTFVSGDAIANKFPLITSANGSAEKALEAVRHLQPDLCFSHNMGDLIFERKLTELVPMVKFMHGYFGTCIGGHKSHLWPQPQPCSRKFGAACLALYYPRRCGFWNPRVFWRDYRWARQQKHLFDCYRAMVVASEHMRSEYIRHGVPSEKIMAAPLFPLSAAPEMVEKPEVGHIIFLGRITRLKGPDLLIQAVAQARQKRDFPWKITIAGEGPWRAHCERLAFRLGVPATFPGWVQAEAKTELLQRAWLLAVPSVWPEPFGLTGLEAAVYGVPAIGFDVGGLSEWLKHEKNGLLAPEVTALALAEALQRLVEEPALWLRLAEGARRQAAGMTIERHVDHLGKLFEHCSRLS